VRAGSGGAKQAAAHGARWFPSKPGGLPFSSDAAVRIRTPHSPSTCRFFLLHRPIGSLLFIRG